MTISVHDPEHLAFPGMSQSLRYDGLLFISGQVAINQDGTVVSLEDVEGQVKTCLANVVQCLEVASSSVRDILKMTAYVRNDEYYDAYAREKVIVLGTHRPASTAIITRLVDDRFGIEVEVIARGNDISCD